MEGGDMNKLQVERKNSPHHSVDLYKDLDGIKAAIAIAGQDMQGKASELFYQSVEDAKEKTAGIKNDVEDYLARKSLKSVGLAFLGGIIVGFFLHKRK